MAMVIKRSTGANWPKVMDIRGRALAHEDEVVSIDNVAGESLIRRGRLIGFTGKSAKIRTEEGELILVRASNRMEFPEEYGRSDFPEIPRFMRLLKTETVEATDSTASDALGTGLAEGDTVALPAMGRGSSGKGFMLGQLLSVGVGSARVLVYTLSGRKEEQDISPDQLVCVRR